MIRKLHHNAYRCRDSEETRRFYEDFLGLPLVHTIDIGRTKTGRETRALHTFYRLDDGSHLAFFETADMPFEFKAQHDFDLHIALEVAPETLAPMLAKGRERGIECRGPSDHGMIESDKAVGMGLIVTELVINAIKYAFPPPWPDAAISVIYRTTGKGWRLIISDNGVGPSVKTGPAHGGLGTAIVEALVKQLGARVETDADPGMSVSICSV